jgi:Serine/threonine protein kinase
MRMKVRVAVIGPNNREKRFWYDSPVEITIGRSRNCACVIDDDFMVSRMHAVLLIEPPAIRIKDLNSTNGIVINGEMYGGAGNEKLLQAARIVNGDEIMLGNSFLRVALVDDADRPEMLVEPDTAVLPVAQSTASTAVGVNPGRMMREDDFARAPVDLNLLAPAIPGYEISSFVGSGRSGSVYRAVDLATGGDMAVKVMFPELAFTRKMADAFRQGVDEMKRFAHPSMVKYHASGDVRANSVYLATEFVSGPSLASVMDGKADERMSFERSWSIFSQLASGLGVAHRMGLLHLDMRLEKILFESKTSWSVKIADIGMARIFNEAGLSVAGVNMNTQKNLAFMAPEQVVKPREMKATADVFGAAAVLYALLAGRSPYNFTDDKEPYQTVAEGDIAPLNGLVPDIPDGMRAIVERCLLPDAESRFNNCEELSEAVARLSR